MFVSDFDYQRSLEDVGIALVVLPSSILHFPVKLASFGLYWTFYYNKSFLLSLLPNTLLENFVPNLCFLLQDRTQLTITRKGILHSIWI